MALSPQWLDELKTRITLSALIMRTTKLQRAGREWKACCPFHDEKSPSFYVNDDKGFYHCFGCQKHGGAIDWMIEQRGLEFMDAVKELAADAGLDLPAPDPRAARAAETRATLHDVCAAAQEWFVANLTGEHGAVARDYLGRRGIAPATIASFGFGYAPDDRDGLARALAGFDTALLIEAGLLIVVDGKAPYARFRGRVMLPIQDARGRVIGFGGRLLEAKEGAPKYLNSPDTPLFDKGRTLYNLHRAAPVSRHSGRVVAVEGYMDVVALAQAGVAEAVAPMGTALTEIQLAAMWRLSDRPILCFDGDKAGKRAAMRAIERALPLLAPGRSLQIVTLPEGLDPDDLVRRDGPAAIERLLAGAAPIAEILWSHEFSAQPLVTPEDKAGLKARLMAHVEAIADPDIAALYRRELLDLYGAFAFPKRERAPFVPRETGRQWGRTPPQPVASPETNARLRRAAGGALRDTLLHAVLEGFARYPREITRHADALLALMPDDRAAAAARDYLIDCAAMLEASDPPPISLSEFLPPPPDNARFSFLVEGSDPDDAREDLAEAVAMLVERPALEAAIAAATARFDVDPEGAFAEQQRLRKRKLEIDSRFGQMARKRAAFVAQDGLPPASVVSTDVEHQETD